MHPFDILKTVGGSIFGGCDGSAGSGRRGEHP
jgi:hypothetical protein